MTSLMGYGLVGLFLSVLAIWGCGRLVNPWMRRPLRTIAALVFLFAALVLSYSIALASGDRSALTLDLGSTITYERMALDEPQKQVFHIASADLDNPCVRLVTTRPAEFGITQAETATEFVARTGSVLSINVAFFRPFDEYPLWDSYPQSGDEVQAIGPVVIDGEWLGDDKGGDHALALTNGQLSASTWPADAEFGVRGREILVADGEVVAPTSPSYPRAVAGVDLDTNRLLLIVADGKQPGYAVGATYRDIAEVLVGLGVDEALEFDGGGSATMAATVDGGVELLSRPSHQRIPGRQRPVASHLGIVVDTSCRRAGVG